MNNSECTQLDIDEVEEFSLNPERADVDMKKILRKAGVKRRQKHFQSRLEGERRRRASGRRQMALG